MRLVRGKRLARAPPSTTKATSGTVRPASTNPTVVAEWVVASAANATAIRFNRPKKYLRRAESGHRDRLSVRTEVTGFVALHQRTAAIDCTPHRWRSPDLSMQPASRTDQRTLSGGYRHQVICKTLDARIGAPT